MTLRPELFQQGPRCGRLLEQLGAHEHFEMFQRVRRGEKME